MRLWLPAAGIAAELLLLPDGDSAVAAVAATVLLVLIPGIAAMRWLPLRDPLLRLVITPLIGTAVITVVAMVMAWASFWHPMGAALAVNIVSVVSVWVGSHEPSIVVRRLRAIPIHRQMRPNAYWLVIVLAVALWVYAVSTADIGLQDQWGLISSLPRIWFVPVAAMVVLAAWPLRSAQTYGARVGAAVLALAVMVFATPAAVEAVPRFQWLYKHIAVVTYLSANGHVDPTIDIYQRWPGFFSFVAFFGDVTGFGDPVAFAAWAEPVGALGCTVLMFVLARAVLPNRRANWTATALFLFGNWVDQYYFAPQTFALLFYLATAAICLGQLRGEPGRFGRRLERILARLVRSRRDVQLRSDVGVPRMPRLAAVAVVLVFSFIIVASHQLTPYMLALGVAPLGLLGYLRPRWIGIGIGALALAYLVPNFTFIQDHFGVFSGFNLAENVGGISGLSDIPGVPAGTRSNELKVVSLGLVIVLFFVGVARMLRAGRRSVALMVCWLALSPLATLLGQSYGGEGRLRAVLFLLPWACVGASWALEPVGERTRHGIRHALLLLVRLGAAVVMAASLIVSEYQREADVQISQSEIVAGRWIDTTAPAGAAVLPLGPFFPSIVGPDYATQQIYGTRLTADSILQIQVNSAEPLTAQSLIRSVRQEAPDVAIYFIFSDLMRNYGQIRGIFTGAELDALEQALPSAGAAQVFRDEDTVVYRVPGT